MACRPDRSTGSRGQIIMQEESCWGQLASGQEARGVDFTTETLRNDINTIESQILRNDRMRSAPQQGNQRPGGDVNGELQPNTWSILLKHALGGSVVTTGSGPYTHVITAGQNLPQGMTMEKTFGFPSGATKILRYYGSKVNEFFVSVPTEGIVTARAGLISKQEQPVTTSMDTTPTYLDNNEPFNSFHGLIKLDGASVATITSLDMLINNSIDGEQFAIDGTKYRADAPEDMRIISGNFVSFFTLEQYSLYTKYLANTDIQIELILARGSSRWEITLPKCKLGGSPTPQIPGRGPLNLSFSFDAFRDDALEADIQVEITNDEAVLNLAA